MTQCNHANKKADCWTNLGTVGEFVTNGLNNFLWGLSLATLSEDAGDDFSLSCYLSPAALSIGVAMALIALGAVYAHRKLFIHHQSGAAVTSTSYTEEDPLTHSSCAHGHSHGRVEHQHAHGHAQGSGSNPLNKGQWLAIFCDYVTHINEGRGAIIFLLNHFLKPTLLGKIALQCGATLFGGSTSYAAVRACKSAIVSQNTPAPMSSVA